MCLGHTTIAPSPPTHPPSFSSLIFLKSFSTVVPPSKSSCNFFLSHDFLSWKPVSSPSLDSISTSKISAFGLRNMDKMLRVQQKKRTKQTKTKNKPVKVVYISNPMKVKTSAAEFRALVQELTGQDADMPDPTKFSDIVSVGGGSQEEEVALPYEIKAMEDQEAIRTVPAAVEYPGIEMPTGSVSDLSFETTLDDDGMFMPQMVENFPSEVSWYEPACHAHYEQLKSLDAM